MIMVDPGQLNIKIETLVVEVASGMLWVGAAWSGGRGECWCMVL